MNSSPNAAYPKSISNKVEVHFDIMTCNCQIYYKQWGLKGYIQNNT